MKTILILSDGMRPDATEGHDVINKMKQNGTYCMQSRTVMPSVTLPSHMSLFHSVDPSRHGITTNMYMPQVRPISGLFEQLTQKGVRCAMFYNWEPLRDCSRPGSLVLSSFRVFTDEESCRKSCRKICDDLIKSAQNDEFDFAFIYFVYPDLMGHCNGWMTNEYLTAVNYCNDLVSEIMDTLGDGYNYIYTADHGGHDRTHGTEMLEDMTMPILCVGDYFEKGKEVEELSIKDIAPTIATMFGATIPYEWEGKVIK